MRAAIALAIGAAVFVAAAIGARALSARLFPAPSTAAMMGRTLDPALIAGAGAVARRTRSQDLQPIEGPPTLEGIRSRGVIRVGYGRDIVPFSYFNARGDLVGFDISYAYALAHSLHVRLELVPIDWETLEADLSAHRFDSVMAGVYVTDERLQKLQVTNSYFVSPVALIARAREARRFLSYDAVAGASNLTLGALDYPVLLPLVRQLFPKARSVVLESYDQLPSRPEVDAAVWSLDQARAWASAHAGFTAVNPSGMGAPLSFAYFLAPDALSTRASSIRGCRCRRAAAFTTPRWPIGSKAERAQAARPAGIFSTTSFDRRCPDLLCTHGRMWQRALPKHRLAIAADQRTVSPINGVTVWRPKRRKLPAPRSHRGAFCLAPHALRCVRRPRQRRRGPGLKSLSQAGRTPSPAGG